MNNEETKISQKSIFDVENEICFGHVVKTCPHCTQDDGNKNCPHYFPIHPKKPIKPAVTFSVSEIPVLCDTNAPSSISVQI